MTLYCMISLENGVRVVSPLLRILLCKGGNLKVALSGNFGKDALPCRNPDGNGEVLAMSRVTCQGKVVNAMLVLTCTIIPFCF